MPSELKVNKLSPYTGTTLTLGDSGDTVSTNAVVQASQFIGGGLNAYRNIIINGDMNIAQRGTSLTGLQNSPSYLIDRFSYRRLGTWTTAEYTMSQDTDVPTAQGFAKSLKIDVTTAEASVPNDAGSQISQRIEGQNLQMLKKGTSNAESLTCSFWVKSNKTGTYIVELFDLDNVRRISKSYSISSASTWEKKTITFEGDTTGAFDNDNNYGLEILWWLASGTNYTSGTLQTSWGSEIQANRAVGQVNLADSTSNYINITGFQLEAGTSASDFEFLPYDVNFQRCQRYYQTISKMSGYSASAVTTFQCSVAFPITMRATPSLSQSGVFRFDDGASAITQSSTGFTTASLDNTGTILNVQNMTCNGTFRPHGKANTAKLEIDAEL